MAYGSLIAYRNFVYRSDFLPNDPYEADAPGENLLTPQLGEIARISAFNSAVSLEFVLEDPGQIGLVGLMAYGEGVSDVGVRLYDTGGDLLYFQTATPVDYSDQQYFPRNFWHILNTPVNNVKRVELVVGMESGHLFEAGGVWAGPAWRLSKMDAGWSIAVRENQVKQESDDVQTRADPQRRFRELSFSLSALEERDALGFDGSARVSAVNSLLDFAFESCVSRPVVVLPRLGSTQRIHALGIYGYLVNPITIRAVNGPEADGSGVNHSATGILVRESL